MSALKGVRRGRTRGLWLVGATLIAVAAFGVIFVASSGAAPSACPIPAHFEIDGDMTQATCNPPADDWNTPNIGVQATTQGGTYKTAGKDDGNPSGWASSGSTPDKTDFAQAYATSRVVNGHFFVFVAWERTATSGTQGYAIEITNAGSHVAADGTPQPNRGSGGNVFYISSQGSSAPAFDSACTYTSQSNYGQTCTTSNASVTSAINSAPMSDPLNGTTQPAGAFFEVALDVTALTGVAPSCPGPSAASVYLRSITGQTSNGNLKGYMAPLNVAPNSTCVLPPITTAATPGGSTNLPGTSQHDTVSVNDGTNAGVGTVKFFLCSPAEVTANGGDCSKNGTQVGTAVTLDTNGAGTSGSVDGTTTPNDLAIGKYCWRAEFTPSAGDHHFLAGSHTNSTTECFTVIKASPTVSTKATVTGTGVVGTDSTSDTATLSGGHSPTGKITFTLTAPDGSTSTIVTDTVTGDGSYSAGPVAITEVGTYTWHASYNGDTLNNAAADDGTNESVTSVKASPSVSTQASVTGRGVVGTDSTSDSATVSGGDHPTGTITFTLKAPDGSTSTIATDTVTGDGSYSAGPVAITQVGTYTWHASYSGDPLNNGAADNGNNESIASVKASPSVSTQASVTGTGVVGTDTTSDSATVSGGDHPTGTITFTLKAPDGSTSTIATDTVTGDGSYSAGPVAITQTGTYTWHAVYSGDPLNNGAADNGNNESITSSPTTPSITTEQDPASGSVGDTYKDKATLSGTFQQSGTDSITWTLYPNDDCTGTPLGTDKVSVSTDGTFETPNGVTVNAAGTYYWVAQFTGDTNNNPATSGCAAEPVNVDSAAIHILKTPDNPQVDAGDQIGFTMTVWNSGTGDAHGVTLTDTLPTNPGLDWQVAGQGTGWSSACSIKAGELTCGPDTVPAGGTSASKDTSTFTVHITSVTDKTTGGDCTGTAGVVDNTGDVSTTNANSDESMATICVAAPVIHILKTADAPQVSAGDDIGFTLTVWNSGIGNAKGVILTDTLPTNPGTSWSVDQAGVGFGSGADCSIAGGVLTCGPETVPAGGASSAQSTSTFWVHITSHTDKTTGGDCQGTNGVVKNTGDVTTSNDGSDTSTATICVAAPAIHILKTADAAAVNVGGRIGFTMTVWNTGTGDAHGVQLHDALPTTPGLSWSIGNQGAGWNNSCAIAAGLLTCGPATVPAGTTQAASTFTVHIVSGTTGATGGDCPTSGVINNTGNVTTSNDGSGQSSASTCVQALVDLSITKSGSPATQELGAGNITWTIVVTNHGPSADAGVTVTDPMPPGNTFVSASSTQGTCTGGALLTCDIGPMAAGATVTVTLVTTPSSAGTQTNTATVSGNRPETNTGNNSATATVQVTAPFTPPPVFCVAVSKVTPGQLFVGRKTTMTIHLTKDKKAVKGIHVRIKGPKLDIRTNASNSKGVVKQTVKMKKAGVLVFTPIASKACNTKRVGITNVFTPPVTG